MARGSGDLAKLPENENGKRFRDLAKFPQNENGKRFKGLRHFSKPGLSQIS